MQETQHLISHPLPLACQESKDTAIIAFLDKEFQSLKTATQKIVSCVLIKQALEGGELIEVALLLI